jgi:medium-chain acyl-[acyl-carrier-protein] hydrolase
VSTAVSSTPWLRDERPEARAKVVCIPHAGAGASSFARWQGLFPPDVSVVRVQLPGREDLASLPRLRQLSDVLAGLLPQVSELFDVPVVLYGHSTGALIAFELARALSEADLVPVHLFVSGRRAPHLAARNATIHRMPDDELATAIDDIWGPGRVSSPALRRYALPIIRSDLELAEQWEYDPHPRLACPITAFFGTEDPLVDERQTEAWGEETDAAFAVHGCSGDHFFHQRHRAEIAGHITTALAR